MAAVRRVKRPPLVGISTSEVRSPQRVAQVPEGEPPMPELAVGMGYPKAVERSGAVPVVLAPVDLAHVETLLDRLGGLLVSGGPDVHPSAYGEEPHPSLGPTSCELDAFELALVRGADARGLPVLGICRGAQILNIARGGTLVQDLPDMVGGELHHRQTQPGRITTHSVDVEEGSRLASVMGAVHPAVNSFHHQAVATLGRHLRPVAWAPDGVVEGIEAADRPFTLGVQWHAESLVDAAEHAALFEALVVAARRFEAGERAVAAA